MTRGRSVLAHGAYSAIARRLEKKLASVEYIESLELLPEGECVPQWVTSILVVAARMKNDKLRRRKAYKMLRKQLWVAGIGQECAKFPTYVYPENIKALIRSVFPEGICNYPDPDHKKVGCAVCFSFTLLTKDFHFAKTRKPCVACWCSCCGC